MAVESILHLFPLYCNTQSVTFEVMARGLLAVCE